MEKDDLSEYLTIGQKIPINKKLFFGLGVFANTILAGIITLQLADYYINIIQIDLFLFGIANIIYLIWNALNDVLFGYYADRTRTKLGRRIPYIRYGAPLFALAFLFFWFPFPGSYPGDPNMGQFLKFLQLLIGYLFFDTMLTIVILSFVALPPEMTESTKERNIISGYRTIFTLFGGLIVLFVPFVLSLGLDVFRIFVIIAAIIALLSYLTLSYKIKERKELYEKGEPYKENILKEIIQTFKNKAFISFLIYNFAVIYITTMMVSFMPFFRNIFGVDANVSTTILLLIFYIGNLITMPILIYFGKKIETRTLIITTSLVCMMSVIILFLIDIIFNLVELYYVIIIIVGALFGLGLFYYPFMSDAIDIDELKTKKRREGMYFGMNALLTKPAEQLPAIIGSFILIITAYIPSEILIEQPTSTIFGFKLMIAVIPIILAIILILSQLINPLKGDYLKQLKENIIKLHENKENI